MARNRKSRKTNNSVAIVGDGPTEQIYFNQMKETESLRNHNIKPELPCRAGRGGGHMRVLNRIDELLEEGHDHIYCLIDYDKVIEEGNVQKFESECRRFDPDRVTILINNPSFEMWYVSHFTRTGKLFKNGKEVETYLKKYIPSYSKSRNYLIKKNIYNHLEPKITSAISNAKSLEHKRSDKSERYPRAEVFKLVEKLRKLDK
ncbi:RloB family protein [Halosquirtibacter laminarini]|uniref:RloB family protein n=1 Tax=Halosquirtibacter laminarini TaxID=3374600 RepID=A0AC61NPT9_9BACT|nr:RloB family protein [Prolixibacteraceae bacterium]